MQMEIYNKFVARLASMLGSNEEAKKWINRWVNECSANVKPEEFVESCINQYASNYIAKHETPEFPSKEINDVLKVFGVDFTDETESVTIKIKRNQPVLIKIHKHVQHQ